MNTQIIDNVKTTGESFAPVDTSSQAMTWSGEAVTVPPAITPETSTDVGLSEQAVLARLEELRTRNQSDNTASRNEAAELEKSQQKRLRDFLETGYEQARELMRDENALLLTTILKNHGIKAGASTTKLMQQIAALQLAAPGSKRAVSSRRDERIGTLYRIFFDKGWVAKGLGAKIIKAKGTTAIIAQDIKDRRDPEEERKVSDRAKAVYADKADSVLTPMPETKPEEAGEWRLALVSVHEGGVRVRQLVGKSDDTATMKARNAYCTDAYIDLRARVFDGTTASA